MLKNIFCIFPVKNFETNQYDFEHVSFSFKVSGVSNQRCW